MSDEKPSGGRGMVVVGFILLLVAAGIWNAVEKIYLRLTDPAAFQQRIKQDAQENVDAMFREKHRAGARERDERLQRKMDEIDDRFADPTVQQGYIRNGIDPDREKELHKNMFRELRKAEESGGRGL